MVVMTLAKFTPPHSLPKLVLKLVLGFVAARVAAWFTAGEAAFFTAFPMKSRLVNNSWLIGSFFATPAPQGRRISAIRAFRFLSSFANTWGRISSARGADTAFLSHSALAAA
jgi:hypothetical protein